MNAYTRKYGNLGALEKSYAPKVRYVLILFSSPSDSMLSILSFKTEFHHLENMVENLSLLTQRVLSGSKEVWKTRNIYNYKVVIVVAL